MEGGDRLKKGTNVIAKYTETLECEVSAGVLTAIRVMATKRGWNDGQMMAYLLDRAVEAESAVVEAIDRPESVSEAIVANYIEQAGEITVPECAVAIERNEQTARRLLHRMIDMGIVWRTKDRKAKNKYLYRLVAGNPYRPLAEPTKPAEPEHKAPMSWEEAEVKFSN